MCGRYAISSPRQRIVDVFLVREWMEYDDRPRYNAAPTQYLPVVRNGEHGRRLDLLHWGLIPSWAKDPAIGNRMINARAESIAEKPAYRNAFKRRRCLVPADGFYEWQKVSSTKKQPHLIRMTDSRLFAFAGLWEHWQSDDGSEIESYTIITTSANDMVRPIHERMPVILPPDDYDTWLSDDAGPTELQQLLKPYPTAAMTHDPVSTRVNNPRTDDPACAQPLQLES